MSAETNPPPSSSASTQASTLFGDDQRALFDELPTYRSVVPSALISPIFGLISVLSFAHYTFSICSAAAVIFGLLALRKIKKYPERCMGEKFAKLGIGLGLVFFLGSFTIAATQTILRIKSASDFSHQYAELIKTAPAEEIIKFHAAPESRDGRTTAEMIDEMKKSSPNPQVFDQMIRPLKDLQALLKIDGETLVYDGIVANGTDGMREYAHAMFKVLGPGNSQYPGPEQRLLLRLNARNFKGKQEWMVDEFRFPTGKGPVLEPDPVAP